MKTFRPFLQTHLSLRDVHIWCARLDIFGEDRRTLSRILSSDEISRAGRFYKASDRLHYIAARGILRCILANYLDLAPDRLVFHYNAYGKPRLAATHGSDIMFNLSHANGMALFAFTCGPELGIDLEKINPLLEHEALAQSFFSAREAQRLSDLPAEHKALAFCQCWTRKEAYIKAKGEGLSIPLDSFEVTFGPAVQAQLLAVRGQAQEPHYWDLRSFEPAAGFVAAVALRALGYRYSFWDWDGSQTVHP